MPIVTVPQSPNANSYIDVAYADAYQLTRLHNAEWGTATSPEKEASLLWAARLLDQENFVGWRTDVYQAMRWPRQDVYDQDNYWIDSTVIPKQIKDAQAELALLLLRSDRTAESGTEGISELKAGPIELKFDKTDRISNISPSVYRMLMPFLEGSGTGCVTLTRG